MDFLSSVLLSATPSSDLSTLSANLLGSRLSLILVILASLSAVFLGLYRSRFTLPPGPFCWPVVGSWLQVGDDLNHKRLALLAMKYGDIFMLQMGQRRIVVVSSAELAKEVLHTQGIEFASRCGNLVSDIFTGNGQDMVFTVYGDHWRRMRRIITVPFCTNKVVQDSRLAWEDEINLAVDDIISRKESFTSGIIIRRRLQLMMYNIIYKMMFNRRFVDENDPIYVKLEACNAERNRLAQSFEYNYGDFMPILRPFLKGYLKQCHDVHDKRLALFRDSFLEERKKILKASTVEKGNKCAIDRILRDQMNHEIDEDNVLHLIESLNVQAIETTLCSMEWVLAEVINNQGIQDRIRKEIDTVLDGAQLTEPDISRLPFLMAVVKESLRLHMPIPLLMPHMNWKQAKLRQYDIPLGTKVLVNAWWIANNPDVWENPEKFLPDRFMTSNIDATGSDFRFLPFGSGRRCCPGSILALPLLALVVGRLVQTYELLPGPGLNNLDMSELGGQSRLHLLNHSLVRVRIRA